MPNRGEATYSGVVGDVAAEDEGEADRVCGSKRDSGGGRGEGTGEAGGGENMTAVGGGEDLWLSTATRDKTTGGGGAAPPAECSAETLTARLLFLDAAIRDAVVGAAAPGMDCCMIVNAAAACRRSR
jgi:hypothetical protein